MIATLLPRFSSQIMLLVLMGSFAACNHASSQIDPAVLAEQRAKLLLSEEPDGVLPVLMAREMLEDSGESIVVLGRVGGVERPWQDGRAAFMMVDPTLDAVEGGEGHVCTDSNCVFCRNKNKLETESLVIVRFLGPDGQPLPIDARELFDLRQDDTVVVRGRATVHELGHLEVVADGLYIRR